MYQDSPTSNSDLGLIPKLTLTMSSNSVQPNPKPRHQILSKHSYTITLNLPLD